MSTGNKQPYDKVLPVAQHIIKKLAPFCDRIEIAGSLRRQRPMIGDIEIVALPRRVTDLWGKPVPDMDTGLDVFLYTRLGKDLLKNGRRYKQFKYGNYKVDLFLPESKAHWGSVFMIRTGSHEFNLWVMTQQSKRAGISFREGLIYDWHGNLIETPEETVVFEALGLPFIPVEFRDDNRWLEIAVVI